MEIEERKLLRAAEKLEKATKKYLKKLSEIDEEIQSLPTQLTRCYNLEKDYFPYIPKIASDSVRLELLYSKLKNQIEEKN